MFMGICSRSQVSVYRTIGPLVSIENFNYYNSVKMCILHGHVFVMDMGSSIREMLCQHTFDMYNMTLFEGEIELDEILFGRKIKNIKQ